MSVDGSAVDFDIGAVVVVAVVVHHIELVAQRNEVESLMLVDAGDGGLELELLLDEAGHFRETVPLEFEEELEKLPVAGIGAGVGTVVFLLPRFEELEMTFAGGERVVPEDERIILVDQIDEDERRFFGQCEPGVGVAVSEPVAGEGLPVLQRGGVALEPGLGAAGIRFRQAVAGFEFAAGEEIGGDVDAPLFQRGDEEIEPVDHCGVQRGGVGGGRIDEAVVVVMETDRIVAVAGDLVRDLLRLLFRRKVRALAEVGSVELQPPCRRLFKPERAIRSRADEAVFPRRSVEHRHEIEWTARNGSVAEIQPAPVSSGGDAGGEILAGGQQDLLRRKGHAQHEPDHLPMGGAQRDGDRRPVFLQREGGEIGGDAVVRPVAAPGDDGVFQIA